MKKEIVGDPGDPENYRRYVEVAGLYFQMKEYVRAVEELGRASELRPALSEPHVLMGDCYVRLGRKKEALACYRKALELNPSEGHAREGIESMGER